MREGKEMKQEMQKATSTLEATNYKERKEQLDSNEKGDSEEQ